MKNKYFIIILDFTDGVVYTSDYDTNAYDCFSDFLIDFNEQHELNLSENNCQWMTVKDELNIKYL